MYKADCSFSDQWDKLQHCCSPAPWSNPSVTKAELFAGLSAARTSHEKPPAALDSLPDPNMKDIFCPCLSERMIQGMLLVPLTPR